MDESCQLMFPGVRSFLVFSSFGFKPPASGFQSLYSTNDKTSRLMVKKSSTVRDTQRGSQNYNEKKRGRREKEEKEKKKRGSQKGREQYSQ